MTGFGQASFADDDLSADVVVRTVNGKHLRTKVSLGISMPTVADRITALVAKHIRRGTVDVFVRLDWAGAGGVAFNERIIASYVAQLERLRSKLALSAELQADRVALLPGAMVADGVSNRAADQVWRKLAPVVSEAIEKNLRMRGSEGKALARALRRNGSAIRQVLGRIESRAPEAVREYRGRLDARVRTLLAETSVALDSSTIAREVILWSERCDITEELCRMRAHVDHYLQALEGENVGRELEFIAQEMHREANTMASKSSDPAMSELIIDLRGEVDAIREQVLNLE